MAKNSLGKGLAIGLGLATSVLLVYFGFLMLQNRTSQAAAAIVSASVTDESEESVNITFTTDNEILCSAEAENGGETVAVAADTTASTSHDILLDGLNPTTKYSITLTCGSASKKMTATTTGSGTPNFQINSAGSGNTIPTVAINNVKKSDINLSELAKCVQNGETVQSCADRLE